MMAGLQAYNGMFLADLANLESRTATVSNQLSSGFRVNHASDDPSAVAPIIAYQSEIASITQVQTNLSMAQTEAQTADGALQSASTLLDQLVTLGANGASGTATAAERQTFGQQVQNIEQRLVALANTSVDGHYIFGGDNTGTAPYTYSWTATSGVTANAANPSSTAVISDSNGNQVVPRLTAQAIFDVQLPAGAGPAPGNIFQAAFDLGQALLSPVPAGVQPNTQAYNTWNAGVIANVQTAIDEVKAGATQLSQATTSYGNIQTWIQQASSSATSKLSDIQSALSSLRDADVATDATQLTLDQTAMQAALAAHGSMNTKSLFNYLG